MIVASFAPPAPGRFRLVFARPGFRGRSRGALGDDLFVGMQIQAGLARRRQCRGFGRVEKHERAQGRNAFAAGQHLAQLLVVFQNGQAAFAEIENEADLLLRGVAAPGHIRGAQSEDGQVGDEPFPPVVRNEADVLAPLEAQLPEPSRECLDLSEERGIADGLELARAVLAVLGGKIRVVSDLLQEQLRNGVGHASSNLGKPHFIASFTFYPKL